MQDLPKRVASSVTSAVPLVVVWLSRIPDPRTKRLDKERQKLENELKRGEGKLNNPGFVSKAPAALIEQERAKLKTNAEMLASVMARIEEMKKL